jgi:hypothetical protein
MAIADNRLLCLNFEQNLWDASDQHNNAYSNNPIYIERATNNYAITNAAITDNILYLPLDSFRHDAFTVAFWFNTPSTNSADITVHFGEWWLNGYCYHIHNNGITIPMHMPEGYTDYQITGTIPNNEWHHMTYTFNMVSGASPDHGGTITAYLDGVLFGSCTPNYWYPSIEGGPGEFRFFNSSWIGSIDLLQYWDRILTTEEIAQLPVYTYSYSNPTITETLTSTLSEWPCNEGTGTTINDSNSINDLIDVADLNWVTGHSDNSYAYDPYLNYVDAQSVTINSDGGLSLAWWVKVPSGLSRNGIGALFRFNGGALYIHGSFVNTNRITHGINGGQTSTYISLDEWNHIGLVLTGTTYQWYINGYADVSGSFSYDLTTLNNLQFGGFDAGAIYQGYVNTVYLWNTAITQSDIISAMELPEEIPPTPTNRNGIVIIIANH